MEYRDKPRPTTLIACKKASSPHKTRLSSMIKPGTVGENPKTPCTNPIMHCGIASCLGENSIVEEINPISLGGNYILPLKNSISPS
jgi:hypothetical protein